MDITFRRQSRRDRWLGWFDELPLWQQAAVVAVPTGLITIALVARRRAWQGVALVATAVEEVADTVEDAAESVRDTAREKAAAT